MSTAAVQSYRKRIYAIPALHERLNRRRRQHYIIQKYVRQDRIETQNMIRSFLDVSR